ncbi:MAG: AbrB/MazE/SpoVT family DNA-binding domain-containing protein [Terracidiphilus sp.]|jgi:AbrB family looped-hinge helix DNA binding protein
MATALITSKGQVTVPIEVRDELGLKSGDRVEFVKDETGRYYLEPKKGSIMNLKGMFEWTGKPMTIEEMDDAIASHLAEDDARIVREYNAHLAERHDK